MRNSVKYIPVLLLGSILSGCSMAGTGDFMADEYEPLQRREMPHFFGMQTSAPVVSEAYAPSTQAYAPSTQAYAPSTQAYAPSTQAYGQSAYEVSTHPKGHQGHSKKGLRKSHFYGEIGATRYDTDSEVFGAMVRMGYQTESIIGAELEGTFGVASEKNEHGNIRSSVKVKNSVAGFSVARLPLSKTFNVLGRAGYHTTELRHKTTDSTTNYSTRDTLITDGVAYGVGAEFAVSPKTWLRADYTIYDYDGTEADSASLTVARKF